VATTHRNHGHIIARGGSEKAALAEILGRADGLNGGYGGTFHLCDPSLGFLSTSGIVGGAISLAVGGGYACKQRGDRSLTMALFGDGALEEGIAFEALSLAALWKLPVVFVCENNDAQLWTGAGSKSNEHALHDLCDLPRLCGIETTSVVGLDVWNIEETLKRAIAHCRDGRGPAFIEVKTQRWPGNRTQWPSMATGRTEISMATGDVQFLAQHLDWFEEHDPVLRLARNLSSTANDAAERIHKIDVRVTARMQEALAFAESSAEPAPQDALRHVFA